jgi:K+-sensing histidine kinase KdpD
MLVTKKHGGDIQVRSKEGQGATFTVLLPRSLQNSDPKLEFSGNVHALQPVARAIQ